MLRGFLGSAMENDGRMPRASGLRSQVQSCPRALKARQGAKGVPFLLCPCPACFPAGAGQSRPWNASSTNTLAGSPEASQPPHQPRPNTRILST